MTRTCAIPAEGRDQYLLLIGLGPWERMFENLLYASRWLLAPIYFRTQPGVAGDRHEVLPGGSAHPARHVLQTTEADLVLVVLSLVDIALVGGLLVMVMLSGYENFVSASTSGSGAKARLAPANRTPARWKQKVASIVAISIHLPGPFMNRTHR